MEASILRLLHISFGIFWAGGTIFSGIFLLPAMGEAGPAGGAVMGGLVKRRMPVWMTAFALITVVSGLRLFMLDSQGTPGFASTPTGICLAIGSFFALVAFVLAMAVQRPTAEKLGALSAQIKAAGAPPSPEQQEELARLGAALRKVAKRTAIFLIHAAVFMGASRLAGQL